MGDKRQFSENPVTGESIRILTFSNLMQFVIHRTFD